MKSKEKRLRQTRHLCHQKLPGLWKSKTQLELLVGLPEPDYSMKGYDDYSFDLTCEGFCFEVYTVEKLRAFRH